MAKINLKIKQIIELQGGIQNMIAAWEALPNGHHSASRTNLWMTEELAPAVGKLRELIKKYEDPKVKMQQFLNNKK